MNMWPTIAANPASATAVGEKWPGKCRAPTNTGKKSFQRVANQHDDRPPICPARARRWWRRCCRCRRRGHPRPGRVRTAIPSGSIRGRRRQGTGDPREAGSASVRRGPRGVGRGRRRCQRCSRRRRRRRSGAARPERRDVGQRFGARALRGQAGEQRGAVTAARDPAVQQRDDPRRRSESESAARSLASAPAPRAGSGRRRTDRRRPRAGV